MGSQMDPAFAASRPLRSRTSGDRRPLSSSRSYHAHRDPQLEHVVGRADQRPFVPHPLHPAPQELPEPPRLLDLSEHRFDDDLAPTVDLPAAGREELARHALTQRHILSGSPPWRCHLLTVLLPTCRDEWLDLLLLQRPDVFLRPVTGIGQDFGG